LSEYKALYRKWRPRDFDSVCGQDGITDILKYEVANDKLSHAYLFCGSRGTGKTSCAKILSKAVNCLSPRNGNPCNKCEACLSIDNGSATDVIEMDAASNNGINDVRDMQDEIAFTPAALKYRVYIIDEVHMMSTQAFNALLKTLEEPPAYVIFILATTEYNKLPTTIVSRCQRFDFKRISTDIIVERLLLMSREEGIEITEDAARVIARVSRGGMRDAISLLELCAGARRLIDEELVFSTVGSGNRESAYKIIRAISAADYSSVYSVINDIVLQSGDLSVFWQEIIDAYRDIMIVKNSERAKSYLDLTDVEYQSLSEIAAAMPMPRLSYHVNVLESAMADMQRAFNSKRSIAEIALTRMCDPRLGTSPEALLARIEELEKSVSMLKLGVPVSEVKAEAAAPVPTVAEVTPEAPVAPKQPAAASEPYPEWSRVIEMIGELKPGLGGFVSKASAERCGGRVRILATDFLVKRLSSSDEDMSILKGVIAQIEGKNAAEVEIELVSQGKPRGDAFGEIEKALNNK